MLPILQDAEAALDTLNSTTLADIKNTVKPPMGTNLCLTVCYMLIEQKHDFKKITWNDCKKMISVGFFDKLKNFKRDAVPDKIVKNIDIYIDQNPDLNPPFVLNSGGPAAFSLCKWALAIVNYAKVAKQVEPKKKLVDQMDQELKRAQAELNAKTEKLREEMKKVEDLERAYTEVKDKKDKLEHEIELCRLRLIRAEKLTTGLGSEHERWKENVEILDQRIK